MAKRKQRPPLWGREEYEDAQKLRREMLIGEFDAGDGTDASLHAMAAEILEYRQAVYQLARAIEFVEIGAPFAVFGPGPHWQPKPRRGKLNIDGIPTSE